MSPFDIAIFSVFLMVSPVIIAPCCSRSRSITIHLSFSITAAASLAAVIAGVLTVHLGATTSAVVQMGLPDLPFHLRLDPLAGFFLSGFLLAHLGATMPAWVYVHDLRHRPARLLRLDLLHRLCQGLSPHQLRCQIRHLLLLFYRRHAPRRPRRRRLFLPDRRLFPDYHARLTACSFYWVWGSPC